MFTILLTLTVSFAAISGLIVLAITFIMLFSGGILLATYSLRDAIDGIYSDHPDVQLYEKISNAPTKIFDDKTSTNAQDNRDKIEILLSAS